jgi:hypothetical protein
MQKTIRSAELDAEIIYLYAKGLTTVEVGKHVGCSATYVINCLKRHDIARRSTSVYNTKYITNVKFFDKIDNEAKAYFLGLLYADGNNYVKKGHSYQISITLQEVDGYILEKLRDYLSPMTKLKLIKDKLTNNNHILFKINSKTVSDQLINLGCIPNKSLVLQFPEIREDLLHHFIRGYFDGDGSLYLKTKSNGHIDYMWQVTSTNKFCIKLREYLAKRQIHATIKLACANSNLVTSTLSVGGNRQVLRLLQFLYQNADIFLKRKYDKFIQLKNILKK